METDQLLDLFNISSAAADTVPVPVDPNATSGVQINEDDAVDAMGEHRVKGKRDMLDDMVALWDERQYEEEYDLDSFLKSMKA
jgi:TATA-binding protein-associated factor